MRVVFRIMLCVTHYAVEMYGNEYVEQGLKYVL